MNTETERQMNVAYNILEEAWTPENKYNIHDESVFTNYVINKWDENTLAEWIMRLINNLLSEYNFEDAETVEEFNAKAEAALKDRRAN
jgi:hypothetical protein